MEKFTVLGAIKINTSHLVIFENMRIERFLRAVYKIWISQSYLSLNRCKSEKYQVT